ncbi:hypothetical protein FOL47_002921 [Perkinsus chesapeaki]|uniref:Uncharacterized protein n=1 Tax=Perkinsus chesapeaki TaxID=330153 RepID=A0A7J6MCC4_PERCH|nr:hypothetical protein FOL47_002921 [Perkinsus chesapeaki]
MSPSRIITSALLLAFMMAYALGGFPQGKYIGGEVSPKPYLRVEGDFNVKTIHLSVSCGPERAKWDAWFDLVEATQKETYKLKGYVTDPKYEKLLTFLTDNCGRAQGQSGDLDTFYVRRDMKSMITMINLDMITLYKA